MNIHPVVFTFTDADRRAARHDDGSKHVLKTLAFRTPTIMSLKETRCEDVNWIQLTQSMVQL